MAARDYLDSIDVLTGREALALRAAFVAARLDYAARTELGIGSDLRDAYSGYLWDYVEPRELVSESELTRRIETLNEVYVMWDIRAVALGAAVAQLVEPAAVLRAAPGTLLSGAHWLPEDLYLFDLSQRWAGSLTHEWLDAGRYCLWSGPPNLT